jgi:indole-3-glycerol phosphate synthase
MYLPLIPEDIVVVSESGIQSRDDVSVLQEAGINALLIGEALVKSRDPGKTLADLLRMEK